jgi:6-pyruvoyl-tetrahydropterin synthase
MILDFNSLSGFKRYLDDEFDHRFFIDQNDPLLAHFTSIHCSLDDFISHNGFLRCHKKFKEEHIQELFDSLVVVSFVPTAEELCKFFYQQVNRWLFEQKLHVRCTSCNIFETPTASATFS